MDLLEEDDTLFLAYVLLDECKGRQCFQLIFLEFQNLEQSFLTLGDNVYSVTLACPMMSILRTLIINKLQEI